MFEKRRYQRISVSLPVTVRYQGRLLPATMCNLSCGGACVHVNSPDVGDRASVEIIFDLDDCQRDVSMRGNVVYCAPTNPTEEGITAGIRFSNLFSNGHRVVQEYLRKNLN